METGEVIYEKVCASPRPPPKISLKHDWMKKLGSEVARQPEGEIVRQAKGSQSTNQIQNQIMIERRDPLFALKEERPVLETRSSREEAENHHRTGRSVVCSQDERSMLNEVDIDFRIPGLPHSVVKQAEKYRVRGRVKQIENHPRRQALQRDLQQNNAYNPFSEQSKKMIKDMENEKLFELFETDLKTQCKECLLYWSQGTVYCTCGHLLKESEGNRGAIQCTLDLLSIQNYVIKKGRPHGHRYGKTTEQRDYHIAHSLRKRCIKRRLQGIHDRFLKDAEFRASQLEHDRTGEVCIQMDELAQKDFSYHMTQAEYFRYRKNWWISLNHSGKTGPLKDRSDLNDALTTLNRLHQESGE